MGIIPETHLAIANVFVQVGISHENVKQLILNVRKEDVVGEGAR